MTARARALALALVAATLVGCGGEGPPPLERLVVAGGPPGSVYQALGQVLAAAATREWGVPAEVLATPTSAQNLRLVGDGTATVAFARVDIADLAYHGDAPFAGSVPVAALAGLYADYVQVVVRADSDIDSLSDLKGRTMATPETGTADVLGLRVMDTVGLGVDEPGRAGVTRRRLGDAESAAALAAGRVDAWLVTGGVPTPAVADLAARVRIRLLPVPDDEGRLEERFGEFYLPRSVPAGTYGIDGEVPTLAIPNVLVVRGDLPETTAHRLTALLFAARAELAREHRAGLALDPRTALATFPVPLHPGAASYYRDTKPLA